MTEEIIPNAIRTWTIFKNTNNTLEGIEAITFAIRQVALDEIEKESDNVIFMSDDTVKIIIGTLKRLEQENAELKRHKRELGNVAQQFVKDINRLKKKLKKIKEVIKNSKEPMNCEDCPMCGE